MKILRKIYYGALRFMPIAIVLCTVFNVYLISTDEDLYVCVSSEFSEQLYFSFADYGALHGEPFFTSVGAVMLGFSLALYLLSSVFSIKNYRWLIAPALMYSADTALPVFYLMRYGDMTYIADIAVHALFVTLWTVGFVLLRRRAKNKAEAYRVPDGAMYAEE